MALELNVIFNIHEDEIINFAQRNEDDHPVSIQDIKKRFNLMVLSAGIHRSTYITYSSAAIAFLAVILVLIYCSKTLVANSNLGTKIIVRKNLT